LISVLVVDDIGIAFRNYKPKVKTISPFGDVSYASGEENPVIEDILPKEVERVNENNKFKSKLRRILRNAAVDGDGCIYMRFNTDKGRRLQVGEQLVADGEIEVEIIDNTNVHLGNTMTADIQSQPWVMISRLKQTKELKEQYPQLAEYIKADGNDNELALNDNEESVTTVLIFMYKENGMVHFCECTQDVMLTEPIAADLSMYPVAFFNWESVKNQYHGVGVVEEVIPNQIEINKLWAMGLLYQRNNAFPKVFVDKTRIANWDNRAGAVIGVVGNPNEAFASSFKAHDMSNQVMQLVEATISHTKEFMGANDAVLGNINPQNTSALIQVQKASAAPLELQRLSFYQFIEDYTRIVIDIMRNKSGVRRVTTEQGEIFVDFSALDFDKDINVDIGASAYFSESAQIQTMDNLFKAGIITDAKLLVESLPDKTLPNKNEILQHLEEQQTQQQMMMAGGMTYENM
ncbi:MAG: hypothetical protein IJ339_02505, partial [Oscillospiraceae bacterium]|nr:hypothetical protein [Oscillospiraceae bacterium]